MVSPCLFRSASAWDLLSPRPGRRTPTQTHPHLPLGDVRSPAVGRQLHTPSPPKTSPTPGSSTPGFRPPVLCSCCVRRKSLVTSGGRMCQQWEKSLEDEDAGTEDAHPRSGVSEVFCKSLRSGSQYRQTPDVRGDDRVGPSPC